MQAMMARKQICTQTGYKRSEKVGVGVGGAPLKKYLVQFHLSDYFMVNSIWVDGEKRPTCSVCH